MRIRRRFFSLIRIGWVVFSLFSLSACLPKNPVSQVEPLNLAAPIASLTAEKVERLQSTAEPTLIPTSTPKLVIEPIDQAITHPVFKLDEIPTLRPEMLEYEIKEGDTISKIAGYYQISKRALIEANDLINPDIISIGQKLNIPPQTSDLRDKGFLILPDGEVVNGPNSVGFHLEEFLLSYPNNYISGYLEPTPTPLPPKDNEKSASAGQPDFIPRSGVQIVNQIALQNSISPKILLALMEFQTKTLSNSRPNGNQKNSVIVHLGKSYESLARQLNWAADTLNYGYYQWKNHRINQWILDDDTVVAVDPGINAGTAALQYLFSQIYGKDDWMYAVSEFGFTAAYRSLFEIAPQNYNWDNTPDSFPDLQLPFPAGEVWNLTSGPHYGWSSGSPWSALDFVPPDAIGCSQSEHWVTASAPGEILYSENGLVLQDLDDDGDLRTGWTLVYLHLETRDRVEAGAILETGGKIGHPSCEGGVSNGSHIHIARRYNGEWIPIDRNYPLFMSGWEAISAGTIYDGYLVKDDRIVEAWYYKTEESEISY